MARLLLVGLLLVLSGCKTPPPDCKMVDTQCAPRYVPTFDNVYANTISTGCGNDRASCHSPSGDSGLNLSSLDVAYASLLEGPVTPFDPMCSEMIVRINAPGEDYQMPPGDALAPADRCALIKWVEAGAPGPGQPFPGAAQ